MRYLIFREISADYEMRVYVYVYVNVCVCVREKTDST